MLRKKEGCRISSEGRLVLKFRRKSQSSSTTSTRQYRAEEVRSFQKTLSRAARPSMSTPSNLFPRAVSLRASRIQTHLLLKLSDSWVQLYSRLKKGVRCVRWNHVRTFDQSRCFLSRPPASTSPMPIFLDWVDLFLLELFSQLTVISPSSFTWAKPRWYSSKEVELALIAHRPEVPSKVIAPIMVLACVHYTYVISSSGRLGRVTLKPLENRFCG